MPRICGHTASGRAGLSKQGSQNPFPSSQDIELIQTAWSKKTGGYRPNQLVTERLLQRFPTDAIIRALEKVAEAQKARAVGVDGQLALAEQLLQEAATT